MKPRVLIGCEFSGVVRRAFAAKGWDAWSCDLQPAEDGSENHFQCDVLTILDKGWDLFIAHPECTYHTVSGARWFHKAPKKPRAGVLYEAARYEARAKAREFVLELWNCGIPKIALENPIGTLHEILGKPSQIIHPYQFGEDASKSTCLWLRGLPLIQVPPEEKWFPPRLVVVDEKTMKRWSNQSDKDGSNILPPSENRWALRSVTFGGFAVAWADQWTKHIFPEGIPQ